jgi:chaperonin cofactor prefoldin
MKTYQELEKQASESKIEFDSIIWQIEKMETQIEEMQKSIISLKTLS